MVTVNKSLTEDYIDSTWNLEAKMTKLKFRGQKWHNVKLKGSILHFNLNLIMYLGYVEMVVFWVLGFFG